MVSVAQFLCACAGLTTDRASNGPVCQPGGKQDFNVESFRCKQIRVTAEFRYREENYQGNHTEVKIVFDEGPGLILPLESAE